VGASNFDAHESESAFVHPAIANLIWEFFGVGEGIQTIDHAVAKLGAPH
jgi:hypothetical protein